MPNPKHPKDYTVGWICAISTEYVAAQTFLDERHDELECVSQNDSNNYTLGRVGKHQVVIAVLPDGEYGTSSAATVARDMLHSFPSIKIGLMVGIGGAAPSPSHDIRLGDIVVSVPRDGKGGVLQYDFGKTIQNQSFQLTGFLNQPPTLLRAAVSGLKAKYEIDGHNIKEAINAVLEKNPKLRKKYQRPDPSSDRLYQNRVIHPVNSVVSCAVVCGDDPSNLILRPERTEDEDDPAIHYGLIASANQLMKDAIMRDQLAAEMDVMCFEMEAAGLMNHFPCLVIRGICDYSDSHKNKEWQGYAAMAAAAYAKDILSRIHPRKVEAEERISKLLSGVFNVISRAEASVNMVRSEFERNENLEILNWLTPIEYGPQHSDYLKRREPGTGKWLLDSVEYQTWLESSKQTLYCPGIPGSGKTILTAVVIDDLTMRSRNDLTIGIAYIYCNFQRENEQTIEKLLASLLKQLSRRGSFPASLKDLYDQHKETRTKPSIDEILKTIQSVSAMYSRVFFVVDALDEYQVSNGGLLKLLSQIFSLQANTGLSFFATSRPIPKIEEEFTSCLRREILATNEDVREYLNGHMSDLPTFVSNRLDIQEEIKTEITRAVKGMFLLAQLYLDPLKDTTSIREMRFALMQLRKQSQQLSIENKRMEVLEKAYEQAMHRIDSQGPNVRALGKKILSWITCAERQLTTLELQIALAVEIGDTELDKDNLRDIGDMVSVCAGLVTIDKESNIIRLVHYTTQEYFERTQKALFPDAESDITRTCITYLSFIVFKSGFCLTDATFEERLRSNQLYDYAAHNWGHHARKSMTMCLEVVDFLNNEANVEGVSQALLAMKRFTSESRYSQRVPRRMLGLHLAAYFGLNEVVKSLLQERVEADATDTYDQTPLSWAARNGHEAVVKLLLENGADIESKDKYNRTPLLWAADNGHQTVVKLLLEKGADIESKDRYDQTPLSWGARNAQNAVVKLLLENGAGIDSKDSEYGRTPLLWAAENGHETVVKLLLDKGADLESKDSEYGRTPLLWAAVNGHETVVKLLLEKGADIESRDTENGQTPLSWAADNGHETVVKLLLDTGADLESKDNEYGRTPLSWAADNGHETVVKLLLDKGADLESKDSEYGLTPLSWATGFGHEAVVQLLLEKGAELDLKAKDGRTPLSWAADYGYETLVKQLLEKDADIELRDSEYGRTPLSWAAENGHEVVVKLLLDKGADVESKDSEYGRTPLSWAARNGNEAVVKLLLEMGADRESKDQDGRTPLSWAADNGHEVVVKLLFEKGADSSVIRTRKRKLM